MAYHRPVSAGARNRRHSTIRSNHEIAREEYVEQTLLNKIRRLAAHHARNVEALRSLNGRSAIPKAWADDYQVPLHTEATSPIDTRTRRMSKDDSTPSKPSAPRCVSTSRRSFTRAATSDKSCWAHKPTVVEPFRSMETHATAWKRKIRQQQENDLYARKEEAEAKARNRERFLVAMKEGTEFSGVISRSNEMMERRRERIREAETKEEAERKQCEFKARPLHITDEDWQTIQERQATRRKHRVQMRKEEMLSKSHLPRRMAVHALRQKNSAAGEADIADHGENPTEREVGGTQLSRSIPYDRIRKVLARRQRLWDKRLAAAKWKKKPVVPQVLPMEEREKVYQKRAKERAQEKQKRHLSASRREEKENRRRKEKLLLAPAPVVPRTTHSFLLKSAQVRARLEKESYDALRDKERQIQRLARQKETGKALADVMRQMGRQQGRQAQQRNPREAEQHAGQDREKYRQALKENKCRLEEATADRPTLWEQHGAEMRKEAAKRTALSTIAERVFREGSAGATDARCKLGNASYKIFDEEERAVLGMSWS